MASRIQLSPRALAGAGLHGVEQQAGGRDAHHVHPDALRGEPVGRRQRLGHDGAHRHDRHGGRAVGPAQRVSARHDLPPPPFPGRRVVGDRGEGLIHRPGGEAQVGRSAAGPPEPAQRGEQRPLDVDGERGLVHRAAGLLQSDGRRGDRLVGAALRRERHPGRGADEDRLAARVDAERPGLQRAFDERVVEHPDRQQRLAPAAPGGAQLAEQADQVGLGDAQLEVLAVRAFAPVQDGLGVVGEPVHALARRPHADLVHPAAEVGRRRDVRRQRDHALRGVRRGAGEVEQGAPERGLGGGVPAGGPADVGGQLGHGVRRDGRAAEAIGGVAAQRRGGRRCREAGPGLVGGRADLLGQLAPLLGGEQRGVVLRVALRGQAVALDRVREEHGRAGVVDGFERLAQGGQVVAAEVADRGVQGGVVEPGHQLGELGVVSRHPFPQLVGGAAEQALVLGVLHLVDPPPQRIASGAFVQLVQQPPVLDGEHLPARGVEHAREADGADVGHDPVEALPVEVDDPAHLAEVLHHRVEDRLPAGALVQLGVADDRVLAPGARAHVAPRQRTPDRGGGADADGAGGVVDGVRVLRPARVALQPAESPQRLQLRRRQLAEQVVDGVQHRRGVRLHRHPVLGAQVVEPQLGHDRHQRRRRGLVAADLQPVGVGPHPVGVVHDRRGQPQHPLLHLAQRRVPVHAPSLVGPGITAPSRACQHNACVRDVAAPRLPREVRVLVFAAFMIAIGYGVVAPALPVFARSFDVSVAAASAVVSAFAVARVLFAPVSGRLVGRTGELPVFCGGLLVVAASSAACALATDYAQLLAFRAAGGLGSTMFTVSAASLLVRISPPTMRGRASGAWATGFLLGSIAGPVVGGGLIAGSLRAPFFAYAGMLVLTVLITGVLLRAPARTDPVRPVVATVTFSAVVRQPVFRAALASNFVNGWTVYGVRVALVPLFVVEVLHRPDSWSGIALAAFAAGTGATLLLGGRWADRRGRRLPILVGSATVAVTSLWIGLTSGMAELVVASLLVRRRHRADEPCGERSGHRRDRGTRPRGEQRCGLGWFPDGRRRGRDHRSDRRRHDRRTGRLFRGIRDEQPPLRSFPSSIGSALPVLR